MTVVSGFSGARAARAVVAALMGLGLVGCSTGLESMPLPVPGNVGGDVTLSAVFANAMNLPTKAKVKLNGADIGEVESITARDFSAYVTMKLTADVPVPADSRAELRSATPLGDIFVAIRPGDQQGLGGPQLHDGAVIGLDRTTSAPAIEDVLGSAALLVNGGAVRQMVSTLNGAGDAMGGRGSKAAALLKNSNELLSRLNARSAQIDGALRSTADLAATLTSRRDTLSTALSAAAPATEVLDANSSHLADLIDTTARITNQLNRFPSMQGTDTRSMMADLNRLSDVFNQIATDPGLNMNIWNRMILGITHITSGPNIHAVGNVSQLAFGAVPDMNYPGDIGMHGPDGTDWHAMVGSLRYEWNLLLSHVYGPEHRPR